MRLKVLIPTLIGSSLVIAILFWHRPVQRLADSETARDLVQSTNLPATNMPIATQAVFIPPQTAILQTNVELPAANKTKALDLTKQFIERRNVPVDFYGEFIDQDSNAISGVNVKVSILHLTMPNPLVPELG